MALISDLWNRAVPGASDQYGASTPVLYALGTDAEPFAKRSYTTVLTAIIRWPGDVPGSGPLRVSLVLAWAPKASSEADLDFLLKAHFGGEEWLERSPVTVEMMPVWERFVP